MSKEIEITVNYGRNKIEKYNIGTVPNRFNVDFFDYLVDLKKVTELQTKLTEASKTGDKTALENVNLDDLSDTLEKKYNLIKTIMIANDYEYDRDFWDLKVSPQETDSFIYQCALKDKSEDVKKKISRILL